MYTALFQFWRCYQYGMTAVGCWFVRPGLEHIRIIRDGTPNQYMVLLKFRDEVSRLCFVAITLRLLLIISHYVDVARCVLDSMTTLVFISRISVFKSTQLEGRHCSLPTT